MFRNYHKNLKSLRRIIFILFFCWLSSPCFAIGPSHRITTIQGRVTEQTTDKPIAKATIKITNLTGKILASADTDNSGKYKITKELNSGYYFIQCQAQGYYTKKLSFYLRSGRTYYFNFILEPIKNSPPKIISLIPKNYSTFVTGDTIEISVKAKDLDRDRLQYRFMMDEKILKNWTYSQNFNFITGVSDRGRHKIRAEVRDNRGGFDSKSVDIYIFRGFPKPGR